MDAELAAAVAESPALPEYVRALDADVAAAVADPDALDADVAAAVADPDAEVEDVLAVVAELWQLVMALFNVV